MIQVFFSNVQVFLKRYFTIYVILDFTPYENNIFPFSAIFDIEYRYITGNN